MTPKPDDLEENLDYAKLAHAFLVANGPAPCAAAVEYLIQHALRTQPPQDGWKDISTAKCDGSAVDLLLNGNARIPECYFDYYTKEWLTCGTDVPVILQGDPFNKITHWMPIPPLPPQPAKTEGEGS